MVVSTASKACIAPHAIVFIRRAKPTYCISGMGHATPPCHRNTHAYSHLYRQPSVATAHHLSVAFPEGVMPRLLATGKQLLPPTHAFYRHTYAESTHPQVIILYCWSPIVLLHLQEGLCHASSLPRYLYTHPCLEVRPYTHIIVRFNCQHHRSSTLFSCFLWVFSHPHTSTAVLRPPSGPSPGRLLPAGVARLPLSRSPPNLSPPLFSRPLAEPILSPIPLQVSFPPCPCCFFHSDASLSTLTSGIRSPFRESRRIVCTGSFIR